MKLSFFVQVLIFSFIFLVALLGYFLVGFFIENGGILGAIAGTIGGGIVIWKKKKIFF